MKRLVWLFCAGAGFASAVDLGAIRTVYLMPMYRGMDQYLANRLTNEHVFQVVTDPKLADAVFTDRIGEAFQTKLEAIVPPPPPPVAPAPPATAPPETGKKAAAEKAPAESEVAKGIGGDTINKLDNPAANSTFGRGKGNVFLVDAKSHAVVWSAYEPSPGSEAKQMDRTASLLVRRIKKDMGVEK